MDNLMDSPQDTMFQGTIYFVLIKLFNIKNKEMNNKQVILDMHLMESTPYIYPKTRVGRRLCRPDSTTCGRKTTNWP